MAGKKAARSRARSRRKLSTIEQAIADRQMASRRAWARRHPERAADEKALKRARLEAIDRFDHKNQGTIETHAHAARQYEGSLMRLYRSGAIDQHQLHAAEQIKAIATAIVAGVAIKTASLETRVDVSRHGGLFFELLGTVRNEVAYTRWRAAIAATGPVMEMIIGETPAGDPVPFTIVAKRYRMHNRKAKRLLIEALDLWPRIIGKVCADVDELTLERVHEEIRQG